MVQPVPGEIFPVVREVCVTSHSHGEGTRHNKDIESLLATGMLGVDHLIGVLKKAAGSSMNRLVSDMPLQGHDSTPTRSCCINWIWGDK